MTIRTAKLSRGRPHLLWVRWRTRLPFMLYLFRRNPLSLVGLGIVLGFTLLGLFAPAVAPFSPLQPDVTRQVEAPSLRHLFGTDNLGFDIFSRVIWAARIDMMVAVGAVLLAIAAGVPFGAVSGYYGGIADDVVMRVMDSQQAFPSYILAMAIVAAIGQNLGNLVFVIAFVNYPTYARLVRAQMLSAKESLYADAARCMGMPDSRVIWRHLLPNCLGPIYVQGSLNAGMALLLAAGLSFVGLGVRVPTPEWGLMVAQGARYIVYGDWWISFFPGAAIFLAVLGFNLLGDGLQDLFDPKRR